MPRCPQAHVAIPYTKFAQKPVQSSSMRWPAFSFPIARFKTRFQRFGFAFSITALCLVLTLVLSSVTNRGVFQLVVVGVALSAWYGGLYPGLFSAVFAATGIAFAVLV